MKYHSKYVQYIHTHIRTSCMNSTHRNLPIIRPWVAIRKQGWVNFDLIFHFLSLSLSLSSSPFPLLKQVGDPGEGGPYPVAEAAHPM